MKKYIVGAALSVGLLVSPMFASAAGLTNVQVQAILGLLSSFGADSATIASVNSALTGGTPTKSEQAFCHNFNFDLTVGNGSNTVASLRQALSLSGTPLVSSYRNDDTDFNESDAEAVVKFQAKYGIRQTGYVGPMTRAKLNALYGCYNGQQSTQTTVQATTSVMQPAATTQSTNTLVPFPVTIVSPNGGESWVTGQKYLIEWKTLDNDPGAMFVPKETAKVYLASNSVPLCLLSSEASSHVWIIFSGTCKNDAGISVGTLSGKYTIIVNVYNKDGKLIGTDVSDKEFNLAVSTPIGPFTFTFPPTPAQLYADQPYTITWTGSDPGVSSYSVRLGKNGKDVYSEPLGTAYASQKSFSWTIPTNLSAGNYQDYQIQFTGIDGTAGHATTAFGIGFLCTSNCDTGKGY